MSHPMTAAEVERYAKLLADLVIAGLRRGDSLAAIMLTLADRESLLCAPPACIVCGARPRVHVKWPIRSDEYTFDVSPACAPASPSGRWKEVTSHSKRGDYMGVERQPQTGGLTKAVATRVTSARCAASVETQAHVRVFAYLDSLEPGAVANSQRALWGVIRVNRAKPVGIGRRYQVAAVFYPLAKLDVLPVSRALRADKELSKQRRAGFLYAKTALVEGAI